MYQGMVLAVHPNKDQFSMVSRPTLCLYVGFWSNCSAHVLGGTNGVAFFISIDEQLQ